jgi:hypothetical protein
MTVSRANNLEKHERKIRKEMKKNLEGSDKCLSTKLTRQKQLKKKT